MGISVVLLAKREAENLLILLPRIHKVMSAIGEKYEVLVIGSEERLDNSEEVCVENGARYIPQSGKGFGGAFRTGIEHASMNLFQILDCDGSHTPEKIAEIYRCFIEGGHDLVIGSRYTYGGETDADISSKAMSLVLNFVFRIVIGVKARDISTNFRMYHTGQLKNITLTCQNFDILQEVVMKLKLNKSDFSIGEVPIIFEKRMHGTSNRQLLKFIVTYIGTVFRLLKMRYGL